MSLSAAPAEIDLDAVQKFLRGRLGVTDIHDARMVWLPEHDLGLVRRKRPGHAVCCGASRILIYMLEISTGAWRTTRGSGKMERDAQQADNR
jgi:hypothetical protein